MPATRFDDLVIGAGMAGLTVASGHFFPSVRKYGKRRVLARDERTLERVMRTAHATLAERG